MSGQESNQTYNRKVQQSEEALPALTEIASARGFIIGRSYPEKVKLAAGKAAAAITRESHNGRICREV